MRLDPFSRCSYRILRSYKRVISNTLCVGLLSVSQDLLICYSFDKGNIYLTYISVLAEDPIWGRINSVHVIRYTNDVNLCQIFEIHTLYSHTKINTRTLHTHTQITYTIFCISCIIFCTCIPVHKVSSNNNPIITPF